MCVCVWHKQILGYMYKTVMKSTYKQNRWGITDSKEMVTLLAEILYTLYLRTHTIGVLCKVFDLSL